MVEGSQDCVPMIVLTADRPHELRATGANQAIDQVLLLYSYEPTTIFYSGGLVSSSSLTMIFSANSLLHHGSEAHNVERTGFSPKTRTLQNWKVCLMLAILEVFCRTISKIQLLGFSICFVLSVEMLLS